ncbi:BspA family leucine-rich repeat surface protein [Pseudactinotalea terrae]|uniref:BspA family leucine-rich repeat surface protein n=1 Tax=Pseudactinotalea terrae TaxID=1743262 RepID=UPI0019D4FA6A|nr:BspA family leucine-rich repeat surface protein [Pseudactinotalea terrae]
MGHLASGHLGRNKGFSLVELLVTIVIIGIVAAIAVPFFMNQRDKGHDAAVRADLKNAATAAGVNYDPDGLGYASEQVFADGRGELRSGGGSYVGFADTDSFVLYGQSRSGRLFTLTSTDGGVPVAVAASTPDAGNPVLATAGLGALLTAAAGGGIENLPGLTDPPPAGIERPYAAVAWGEGETGEPERASEFFPGDGPAPGDGDGDGDGGIVTPTSSTLVYDMSLPSCPAASTRTLHVPAFGSDYAVDWGDGTASENANSHTYEEPGRYTVTLTGTIEQFGRVHAAAADRTLYENAAACLADVAYYAPLHQTVSMSEGFYKAVNLPSVTALDTTGVVDLSSLFNRATSFNGPLNLNTSAATNMAQMFRLAQSFNQPLEFDTSNVTNMYYMFAGAAAFNQPLSWNTGNVTTMYAMFYGATSLNQPLGFDTGNVTTMYSMFSGAAAFNQPLQWDTGNVADMSYMFYQAPSFNQPLDWDLSKVTTTTFMFSRASAFNQPLSWDTGNVTTMYAMFHETTSLNQPLDLDTGSVTNMYAMFSGAIKFNQPLNFDTADVTNFASMFSTARAFDRPLDFDTANGTTFDRMFYYASAFDQDISSWSTASHPVAPTEFSTGSPLGADNLPLAWR